MNEYWGVSFQLSPLRQVQTHENSIDKKPVHHRSQNLLTLLAACRINLDRGG